MEVLTLKAVARYFGVKPHTVGQWKRRGCPALQHPPYRIDDVGQWKLTGNKHGKHVSHVHDIDTGTLARRKLVAEVKRSEHRADLEAFRMAARVGRLLDATDVTEIVQTQSVAFRQALLSIPQTQPVHLVNIETAEQAETVLRRIVFAILEKLSVCPRTATQSSSMLE